ncbi:DUF3047 domain-containing protein [Idiomarina loihiensis]|uniref:DUF3047 domain-containing protein n=1 Tax=Idiomarina loihiensis TaxID=135577 RepID=UPI003158AD64
MSLRPFVCAFACCLLPVAANAQTFFAQLIASWDSRSFAGASHYEQVKDNRGNTYLKASCQAGNASALYRDQSLDITTDSALSWTWRLPSALPNNPQELQQQGDDFSARLYVVVKRGFLNLNTVAINYVWSSNQPIGASWSNPFTEQAMMVVVANTTTPVGQWQTEHRNIRADFNRFFDIDISTIDGLAIMVDCDNYGVNREFHLRRITLSDTVQ